MTVWSSIVLFSLNEFIIGVTRKDPPTQHFKIVAMSKEEFIQKCSEGEELIAEAQKDDTEVQNAITIFYSCSE